MQNEGNNLYIEAIKLAAGSVQYKNLSIKNTFIEAVSQLYHYYTYSENIEYLNVAVLHIQAYLEMGFPYEDGKGMFDCILAKLGTSKELKFPTKFYEIKKIRLNKTQIRSVIKKWPASPHQKLKIEDVVTDIIERIEKREIGIFYYRNVVMGDIYELIVNEKENLFHDLSRGIFYTFVV